MKNSNLNERLREIFEISNFSDTMKRNSVLIASLSIRMYWHDDGLRISCNM